MAFDGRIVMNLLATLFAAVLLRKFLVFDMFEEDPSIEWLWKCFGFCLNGKNFCYM